MLDVQIRFSLEHIHTFFWSKESPATGTSKRKMQQVDQEISSQETSHVNNILCQTMLNIHSADSAYTKHH